MIAGLVKAIMFGFIGWAINEALGHRIIAKTIVVLTTFVCINVVVQGCQPYIQRTERGIEKVEKFMDKVYKVEETEKKLDKTEQKIKKFLFEPPKVR